MKFAFSTVSCPKWDFETICTRAREYGYDGIEIRGFLNEPFLTASNVFHTDPAKLRAMFKYHQLEIACLASSIAMTWNKRRDRALADDARRFIDTAAALGCGLVKMFDTTVRPGHSRASAGVAFGDWLLPLGDYAADRDVVIVVEGTLSFRSAKELWAILDRLQRPSIAACWDIFNAALVGESPYLSVPVLNSKIQYTQVKDAKLGPLGAHYCRLGEGDVPVEEFMKRLMGIGYDGWVTFEWEKAWLPNIAEPEDILPDAIQKLRKWTASQVEPAKPVATTPAKESKPVAAAVAGQ